MRKNNEKYLSQYPKLSFYHAYEQWLSKTIHQNDNKLSVCIKVILVIEKHKDHRDR